MERKAAIQKVPFELISTTITFVLPSSCKSGQFGKTSTSKRFRPLSVNLQTPPPMVNALSNANVTVKSFCMSRFGLLRTGTVGSIVILLSSLNGDLPQGRSLKVAGLIYRWKHGSGKVIRTLQHFVSFYVNFLTVNFCNMFFFSLSFRFSSYGFFTIKLFLIIIIRNWNFSLFSGSILVKSLFLFLYIGRHKGKKRAQ